MDEAAMSQKPCPKCDSEISERATVCPICRSNLRPASLSDKILGLRDYITLPTAVLALIAALFTPINESVRRAFGWDGAKLDGHVLSFDIINVGTDDRPADKQVNTVTQYEKLLRVVLFNSGYSFATLQSAFVCAGAGTEERTLYTFNTFDPKQQVKIFSEIKAGETISLFGKLNDNNVYWKKDRPGPEAYKCSLGYSDKYGTKVLQVEIKKSMLQPFDG
jgi:hypothetical protein